MDKENPDRLHEPAPARNPEPKQPEPGVALPSQIGNKAFTSLVQRAATSQGAGPLDPQIAKEIQAEKGSGAPLDDSTREKMEGHLGSDLAGVRVHTDGRSDQLNRSVQAEAFTTGDDVFFKSGKYAPTSTDGQRLLAHELTHVVQQRSGAAGGESRVSDPGDPHEVEAKSVGDAVASAPAPATTGPSNSGIQRQEEEEEMLDRSAAASVDREEAEEEEEMLE